MNPFKPIAGYEGKYIINEIGDVFYVGKDRAAVARGYGIAPKKTCMDKAGYVRVTLVKGGKSVQKLLHNLLAEAFIEKPPGTYLVDHINGVTNDNRLHNLRWVTQVENQLNRHRVVASSGYIGVHRIKGSALKPWMACGKLSGKQLYLGTYATIEEAVEARKEWEASVGSMSTSNTTRRQND